MYTVQLFFQPRAADQQWQYENSWLPELYFLLWFGVAILPIPMITTSSRSDCSSFHCSILLYSALFTTWSARRLNRNLPLLQHSSTQTPPKTITKVTLTSYAFKLSLLCPWCRLFYAIIYYYNVCNCACVDVWPRMYLTSRHPSVQTPQSWKPHKPRLKCNHA